MNAVQTGVHIICILTIVVCTAHESNSTQQHMVTTSHVRSIVY